MTTALTVITTALAASAAIVWAGLRLGRIEGTSEVADNIVYLHRDPDTRATVVGDGPESMEVAA